MAKTSAGILNVITVSSWFALVLRANKKVAAMAPRASPRFN
jgi:hypothetical protein